LGTVNLGAIDEFKRVAERVDFLTAQKQDLVAGEKDLLAIIAELDSRMEEKFATTFTGINTSFNQVFRELFGGGRARLFLTDPDNPLEAGVEIVAQPPGKKLQHLSLLSGGEKALTAIALFFAFLKVRPTPFCILDEIETALDDANLARFCTYLKDFARQTQFILISHRKKTMEQADILYGVTMEESGVSKIISVRLRDDKNSAAAGA
jgi:chromosome segregation protein